MLSLLLAAGGAAISAWADEVPDFEREARIVEQVEPYLFEGEPLWLEGGGREFLAVHIEVEEADGTVILLHGRDVHLDEEELIGPLRTGLAERGWATLSLQMPVLAKGKTYYDYLPILGYAHPRIEAAIDYLESRGVSRIILAAHSCGVHMANDWMNSVAEPRIDGYIAMGLGVTDVGQDLKTPFPIGRLSVPVLDIYGTGEYPRPLAMVPHRQELLRQNGNPLSAQVPVEGATHFFRGYGDVMIGKLADWLDGFSR
ncbi:MAG: DUF3530 family protein [Gammaproteobacteria bacterium]|nr:DUF3530 family protein [Gammaproteobacteria bacterium]MYD75668.1 DUF3530 family protein [Gammaproteobacteria bacterium]MYJ51881.1 DUF3530 family protein [Gammaproteobacteria bacterium]